MHTHPRNRFVSPLAGDRLVSCMHFKTTDVQTLGVLFTTRLTRLGGFGAHLCSPGGRAGWPRVFPTGDKNRTIEFGSGHAHSPPDPDQDIKELVLARGASWVRRACRSVTIMRWKQNLADQGPGSCHLCMWESQESLVECAHCERHCCTRCRHWEQTDGSRKEFLLCWRCFKFDGATLLKPRGVLTRNLRPWFCKAWVSCAQTCPNTPVMECDTCNRWLCKGCGIEDYGLTRCVLCPVRASNGIVGTSLQVTRAHPKPGSSINIRFRTISSGAFGTPPSDHFVIRVRTTFIMY